MIKALLIAAVVFALPPRAVRTTMRAITPPNLPLRHPLSTRPAPPPAPMQLTLPTQPSTPGWRSNVFTWSMWYSPSAFVLEKSVDLTNWSGIITNNDAPAVAKIVIDFQAKERVAFYRMRALAAPVAPLAP